MSDTHHGTIWWSELMTRDVEAAKTFYAGMCGWSFGDMPMEGGSYTICSAGDKPIAGILDITSVETLKDSPAHWFTYIAVDDVDKAVAGARDAGGSVLKDAFDVAGVGRIAIIQDPTGAALGIMTPAQGN